MKKVCLKRSKLVAEEFDLSHLFSLYIDAIKLIIDTLEAYFENTRDRWGRTDTCPTQGSLR